MMDLDPHPIYNALIRELAVAERDEDAHDTSNDMPGATAAHRAGDAPASD